MIHPQVMFLGDPAAATPYVGLAKKLARQTFKARIRNKTYKVGDATIRVENLLPVGEFAGKGISKVWIDSGYPPAVLVMSAGVVEYGPGMWRNDNTRARLNLFKAVKKPYDPSSTTIYKEPNIPYGPYNLEQWDFRVEFRAVSFGCDAFIPNILCSSGKDFRMVGYKSNSTETVAFDEYKHYKVVFNESRPPLAYLYSTPYWDSSLLSFPFWLFATDKLYLYETVSTGSNSLPWCWWSVRSATTGEMLLEKQSMTTTNMYGIAALNGYVFLAGARLAGEETTRLYIYKVRRENGVVLSELVWALSLDWQQWYVDAVAMNSDCVYVFRLGKTISAFSKLTGAVVGELVLPDVPEIDPEFGGAYFYEGIATNEKHLIAVSDNHWFFYYKRNPVYVNGDIVSETYSLEYQLVVTWALPSLYGEYDPSAVIAR